MVWRDPCDQQEYVLIPATIFVRLAELVDAAEDEAVREAWLQLSEREAATWIRSNPY
jgi:hypothetical protein